MPPKTQMVPSASVTATASRATRASAIGRQLDCASTVGSLGGAGACPPPVGREEELMTAPTTNSSTAATAADAISIRLRFRIGGVSEGTGPDGGPGGPGGTCHGRLDPLTDAVRANMSGDCGGVGGGGTLGPSA